MKISLLYSFCISAAMLFTQNGFCQTNATRVPKSPANTTKQVVFPTPQNGYPANPWRTNGSWDYVFDGLDLTNTVYKFTDLNNLLIINCKFKDVTITGGADGIPVFINSCDSVYLNNVSVTNANTKWSLSSAIRFLNSNYIVAKKCTIDGQTSTETGSVHLVAMNVDTICSNVTIEDCTISNVGGEGIGTAGKSGSYNLVHDNPVPNLIIRNNIIFNTGLIPDRSAGQNSPTHGMYIKAVDAIVENNTVYNCYDGSCLSIRSSGIVRGNRCWNSKGDVFAYWPQKPGGPSQTLIVENNVFYSTANPNSGTSTAAGRGLGINQLATGQTIVPFMNFLVRFNTVYMAATSDNTYLALRVDPVYTNAQVYGNLVVDARPIFKPFGRTNTYNNPPIPALAYFSGNYITNDSTVFYNVAGRDFHLKQNYFQTFSGTPALPLNDIEGTGFANLPASKINPGAYQKAYFTALTNQTPTGTSSDSDYELGMKFSAVDAGKITKIRFYKAVGETGNHTGRIWNSTGSLLASVNFTNETTSGWQTADLSTPLNISAYTQYIVSVNANTHYVISQNGFQSSISNGPLSCPVNGGVFNGTPGQFPTSTWNRSNYFRDVVFQPEALITSNYRKAAVEFQGEDTLQDMTVFPNPVSGDKLYFKGTAAQNVTEVQILGISGRIIMDKTPSSESFISVDALKAGVYVIKFTTDKGVMTRKITVQ